MPKGTGAGRAGGCDLPLGLVVGSERRLHGSREVRGVHLCVPGGSNRRGPRACRRSTAVCRASGDRMGSAQHAQQGDGGWPVGAAPRDRAPGAVRLVHAGTDERDARPDSSRRPGLELGDLGEDAGPATGTRGRSSAHTYAHIRPGCSMHSGPCKLHPGGHTGHPGRRHRRPCGWPRWRRLRPPRR